MTINKCCWHLQFGTFQKQMLCFDLETGGLYLKVLNSIVLCSCTRFPFSNLSSIFLLRVQTVCGRSFQSWSVTDCFHLSSVLTGTSQYLLVNIQLKTRAWIFSLVWSAGSNKKSNSHYHYYNNRKWWCVNNWVLLSCTQLEKQMLPLTSCP